MVTQPEKAFCVPESTMVEHNFNTRHHVDFSSTSMLDKAAGYMDHLIREATEIRLNTKNLTEMVASH
jgi:hypothetical protein